MLLLHVLFILHAGWLISLLRLDVLVHTPQEHTQEHTQERYGTRRYGTVQYGLALRLAIWRCGNAVRSSTGRQNEAAWAGNEACGNAVRKRCTIEHWQAERSCLGWKQSLRKRCTETLYDEHWQAERSCLGQTTQTLCLRCCRTTVQLGMGIGIGLVIFLGGSGVDSLMLTNPTFFSLYRLRQIQNIDNGQGGENYWFSSEELLTLLSPSSYVLTLPPPDKL